jgi:hypothetical protein
MKRTRQNDPCHDVKIWHKAHMINNHGRVSALCFVRPRAIALNQRWTIDERAVTCKRCLNKIAALKLEGQTALLA